MMAFREDPRAHRTADECLGLAQALDVDSAVMATVLAQAGTVEQLGQRVVQGNALLAAAARLAEQGGHRIIQAHALNNLATGLLISDQQASVEAARTALQLSRQLGDRYMLDGSASTLAEALFWLGRWDDALAELEQAAADLGARQDSAVVDTVVRTLRGEDPDEGGLLSTMRSGIESQDEVYVTWADATAAAAADDPARVVDLVRPLFREGRGLELASLPAIAAWNLAARCSLALGDVAETRRLVADLDQRLPGHVPALLRAIRSLTRASLAALGGIDASALFGAATAELRAAGSSYDLALGLLAQAEHLCDRGDDVSALVAEAEALNAPLRVAEIARRLAALRAGASRTATSGVDGGVVF